MDRNSGLPAKVEANTQLDHASLSENFSTPPVRLCNALTIDVEDYFQVEAFAKIIDRKDWESQPRRVVQNTNRLLDILSEAGVVATFFTLGWVGERHPELVKRIVAEGHELASHGSDHYRADRQSPGEFRTDMRRSKALLEDIAGVSICGFRAPTFSISSRNRWVYEILAEEGFRYSSSVYPIAHDLYGEPDAPRVPFSPHPGFIEIPLTTVRMFGRNFPTSGGGYFRLLPYHLSRGALRRATRELNSPCVFYIHPWEIDPDQPRQENASRRSQFRHYLNLSRTEGRLCQLLQDFSWSRMDRVFLGEAINPPALLDTWQQSLSR
jgi:polysaccharide deacetylase family protein (PEP-CTERM system associated)